MASAVRTAGEAVAHPNIYKCGVGLGLVANAEQGVMVLSNTTDGTLTVYTLDAAGRFTLDPAVGIFGKRGSGELEFEFDAKDFYGGLLCFGEPGRAFVAEFGNNRVQYVDVLDRLFVKMYGVGHLQGPRGVAYCPRFIAVSESRPGISRISMFALDGALLRVIGSHGTGAGELQTPMGLRFSPDMEEVIVADSANSRICKFRSSSGAFVGVAGGKAQGLDRPLDVEVTPDGYFVANGNKSNLVQLSLDPAERHRVHCRPGKQYKEFTRPSAISVLSTGVLVVRDSGNTRVQVLSL